MFCPPCNNQQPVPPHRRPPVSLPSTDENIDLAKCKGAFWNFMISGSLDALTVVGGAGILIRGALGYRVGTAAVTRSLVNPYARRNIAAVAGRMAAEGENWAVEAGGEAIAGGGSTRAITGEVSTWDFVPVVASIRAYKAFKAACP